MTPLTSNQWSIWFDHMRYPDLALYNIGGYFTIEGNLDPAVLNASYQKVIADSDALRIRIIDQDGIPFQSFSHGHINDLPLKDFSDSANPEKDAIRWMQEEFSRPITLEDYPLFRFCLVKSSDDLHFLLAIYHHIIIDGWGISTHFKYLTEAYNTIISNDVTETEKYSFEEYVSFESKYKESDRFTKDKDYWKEKLKDIPLPIFSKSGRTQPLNSDVQGGRTSFNISWEDFSRIQELSTSHRVTVFHFFLALINVSISRVFDRDRQIIGIPLLNRGNFNQKRTIGLFTGMSPLLVTSDLEETFVQLLAKIRGTLRQDYRHQSLPINEINKAVDLKSQGQADLYDITFSYEKHQYNYSMGETTSRMFPLSNLFEQIPLAIYVREYHEGQHVDIDFKYNLGYFSESEIDAYVNHLEFMLYECLEKPDSPIKEIGLLPQTDMDLCHQAIDPPSVSFGKEQMISSRFEQIVRQNPMRLCVISDTVQLTYEALNKQANQLAHLIVSNPQFELGGSVGVLLGRSQHITIAILAVLKAGGHFVPLDTDIPEKRLLYMMNDCQCKVLICDEAVSPMANLPKDMQVISVDDAKIKLQPDHNPDIKVNTSTPAYVIYTSGSTGAPKGVRITHENLSNYVQWSIKFMRLTEGDNTLLLHSFAFDGSYTNLFGALLSGGCLGVVSKETLMDPDQLIRQIGQQGITWLKATPSMFASWLQADNWRISKHWNSVKTIMLGGEGIRFEDVLTFHEVHSDIKFINHYGPTETTIGSLAGYIDFDSFGNQVHIGKPIDNTGICILSQAGELLPYGIPGELCISGNGVGLGYLNLPELTNAVFTPHPFLTDEVLYHTGDRARWLPDGNVAWMGRMDQQVKVRGYRIEPGEIENCLLRCPGISTIVVLPKEGGNNQTILVAYWISDSDEVIEEETIRDFAAENLPEYMMPHMYLKVDTIPFNSRGKIDKTALNEMLESQHIEEDQVLHEHTSLLVQIWKSVLGVYEVKPRDNFFALGGDSIKALQIVSKIRQENLKCEIADIFKYPTISSLASQLKLLTEQVDQQAVEGRYTLTPIQESFFTAELKNPNWFNHSIVLSTRDRFDVEALKNVIEMIVQHHDALRTVFIKEGEQVIAEIRMEGQPPMLEVFDLSASKYSETVMEERILDLQQSIELDKGPLMKAALFRHQDEDQLFLLIHHLVVDGYSWRILVEDLLDLYERQTKDETLFLPTKSHSFIDWSRALNEYNRNHDFVNEINFWNYQESQEHIPLKYDFDSNEISGRDLSSTSFTLSKTETEKILKACNQAFNTSTEDLLLTALISGLTAWLGAGNIALWLESHGRENITPHLDLSRTVGWFTSKYPMLLNTGKGELISQIKEIKEQLRQVPHNGISYGLLRYFRKAGANEQLQFNLNPGIQFNYLGQIESLPESIRWEADRVTLSSAPEESRGIDLNFEARIYEDKLHINLEYTHNRFSKDTIQNLLTNIQHDLDGIIETCTQQKETILTPSDLSYKGLDLLGMEQLLVEHTISPSNLDDLYPISSLQEGMLFHALLDPNSDAYFAQKSFRIKGRLDTELFEHAWKLLTDRHEALRTKFILAGTEDQHLQAVLKHRSPEFIYEDFTALNPIDQGTQIEHLLEADKKRSFDLQNDVLVRIHIVKLDHESFLFSLSHPHIILDGWSMGIIFPEFFKIYQGLLTDHEISLDQSPVYKDYIHWQQALHKSAKLENFWKEYLAGFDERTPLPLKNRKRPDIPPQVVIEELSLSKEQTQLLNQTALENQVTLNIVITGLWGVLLSNYNDQDDVVFGTTMAGRSANLPGIDRTAGMFINTVPIRVRHKEDQSLAEHLGKLREDYLQREQHQYHPLADIQTESSLNKELFDHILVFENYPIDERLQDMPADMNLGFHIEDVKIFEQTNFDLTVVIYPGDELRVLFYYDKEIFEPEVVAMWKRHLLQLVDSLVKGTNQNSSSLRYLTVEEENRILHNFNQTQSEYPEGETIVSRFEKQVALHPNRIALSYQDSRITYDELNRHVNSITHYLQDNFDIQSEEPIGVLISNSAYQIIALLAILKAGGCYVPCDPEYPKARIDYILNDVKCKIIISEARHIASLGDRGDANVLDVRELQGDNDQNPEIKLLSNNLAYVLYTSGSTGNPKGCMAEHGNVLTRLINADFPFEMDHTDISILAHTYCFDVSVWEIYGALLFGGKLIIPDRNEIKDSISFLKLVEKHKVTLLSQTPGSFYNFSDTAIQERADTLEEHLRYVFLAGEKLELARLVSWAKHFSTDKIKLINLYGITEVTIHATNLTVTSEMIMNAAGESPVGVPLPETSIYILDKKMRPLPIGIPGEIYVGGNGVIRGYWGNPEMTTRRYLDNPFREGDRIFRSGDQARWTKEGTITFINRLDDQVKIRGFRVETAEIVQRLLKHESISEAAVLAKPNRFGDNELLAYIVRHPNYVKLDIVQLRSFLEEVLPEYMLPSHFFQLDELPLTGNNKLDKKRLPLPGHAELDSGTAFVAPGTRIEKKLVEIFESVLEKENIGIRDNFFHLGGHSLKATRLISRIQKNLQLPVSLSDIFRYPTIEALVAASEQNDQQHYTAISPLKKKDWYPLSHAQRRLWVLQNMNPESVEYNITEAFVIKGHMNTSAFGKAVQALVQRHESLRTVFEIIDGVPRQVIHDSFSVPISVVQTNDNIIPSQELIEQIKELASSPFDLSTGPLIRISLFNSGEKTMAFAVSMHHIVTDGWSMSILVKELMEYYEAICQHKEADLMPLTIQYKEYTDWMDKWLESNPSAETAYQYWQSTMGREIPLIELTPDFRRPKKRSGKGGSFNLLINSQQASGLKEVANNNDASLFMILLTLVKTLVYRYTNQEDIIIGSPVAGRSHPDLEEQIGYFINTLPFRNTVYGQESFVTLLKRIKDSTQKILEHQMYPVEKLISELEIERNTSRNPLYDIVVVLQNTESTDIQSESISTECIIFDRETSKFDLTFTFSEVGEELNLKIEYATDLYEDDTARRIGAHLLNLVNAILANADQELDKLSMLSADERTELNEILNDTRTAYPTGVSIVDLFEKIVDVHPDSIAVISGAEEISYKELNRRANQIAHYLIDEFEIEEGDFVSVLLDNSTWVPAAFLGILKTGAAYVPIDPAYPSKRQAYILGDTSGRIILTEEKYQAELKKMTIVPALDVRKIHSEKHVNPIGEVKSSNVAYVIYTSGSTGKPKGCLVEHGNLVRLLVNDSNPFDFHSDDVWIMAHSSSFDFSVWEMYGALLYGGKLVIPQREEIVDISQFLKHLHQHKVTVLNQTPGAFYMLDKSDAMATDAKLSDHLRYVIFGGDRLELHRLIDWIKRHPLSQTSLINMYGITETTVHVTYGPLSNKDIESNDGTSIIGVPLPETAVYILNKSLEPMPRGGIGELYIGGTGVTRGYLNRKKLTEEKFLPNPFVEGEKIYKTGDLGRWASDGRLEFIGRIDNQVQIRGYRIETGEVAAHINRLPYIEEAVVIAVRNNEGYEELAAYLVFKTAEAQTDASNLRIQLESSLPDYMIPTHFIPMEEIPLSFNGKLDRKALPQPGELSLESGADFVQAQSQEELVLAKIWSDILGRNKIGVHDRFFSLGGDSIKAMQIVSRLNQEDFALDVRDIFSHPTIAELAPRLGKFNQDRDQGSVIGEVRLTPIQNWLFDQFPTRQQQYNQSATLYNNQRFQIEALQTALDTICHHHDQLRATFRYEGGKWKQMIHVEADPISIQIKDLRQSKNPEEEFSDLAAKSQAGFNLSDPLLNWTLYRLPDGDRLHMVIHHLIIDGVSWRIMLEDFQTAYRNAVQGDTIKLPAKTSSFQLWSETLYDYTQRPSIQGELDYWKTLGENPGSSFSVDKPNSKNSYGEIAHVSRTIDKIQTEALLNEATRAYYTEVKDILLSALARSLRKWQGLEYVHLFLEGHGRESLDKDLDVSRTVGWFTTLFPFVLDCNISDPGLHIKSIKEAIRQIPNKGIAYGMLKYLSETTLDYCEDNIQISFNYLGEYDQSGIGDSMRLSTTEIGSEIDPTLARHLELEISAVVTEGELKLDIGFNKGRFHKETISELADSFSEELNILITHCTSRNKQEKTPGDLTYNQFSIHELDLLLSQVQVPRYQLEDIYPLSPMQSGMLFHASYNSSSSDYMEQFGIRLKGKIDLDQFRMGWERIVQTYEVLRTLIVVDGLEEPMQIVLKERELDLSIYDMTALSIEDQEKRLSRFRERDRSDNFRLDKDPLFRISLSRLDEESWDLLISHHHIILDGWSLQTLFGAFFQIYFSLGKGDALPAIKSIPYRDHIKWLSKRDRDVANKYWKEYLNGYDKVAALPGSRPTKNSSDVYEFIEQEIDDQLTTQLRKLSEETGSSLNTLLVAAWGVLLARYNDTEDVAFGMTVSGRSREVGNIEEMVGLYINTLPVRVRFDQVDSFRDLVKSLQDEALERERHEFYPLGRIQSSSVLKDRLLDHIMVFENYPLDEQVKSVLNGLDRGFDFESLTTYEKTNYSFLVVVRPGSKLTVRFNYDPSVYPEWMVKEIRTRFYSMLRQLVEKINEPLNRIDLMKPAEHRKLQQQFNGGVEVYSDTFTIHQVVSAVAKKFPDNPAVEAGDHVITYHQLEERSNRIASDLRYQHGIQAGDVVAVHVQRDVNWITSLLGIWKSGGVYVPLDPEHPEKRLAELIHNSEAKLLIAQRDLLSFQPTCPVYDPEVSEKKTNVKTPNGRLPNSRDLAYIIYTSGSTGRPKGVMLEHRGFINMAQFQARKFGVTSKSRVLQFASPSFDASLSEIFMTLFSGATLILADARTRKDAIKLGAYIVSSETSVLTLPPALLSHIPKDSFTDVKTLITAGESPRIQDVLYYANRLMYFNAYGPTEYSVCATMIQLDGEISEEGQYEIPIGGPIANTRIYILNQSKTPVPVGVSGEIYISGPGIARGYLGEPELTEKYFLDNPFNDLSDPDHMKMYKTGDAGKWMSDGTIVFLGRVDEQLKIRGSRVEPAEVAVVLSELKNVRECWVGSQLDHQGQKELIAWYVLRNEGEQLESHMLQEYIQDRLPAFMVPKYFVKVESLPLTASGKVDRRQLPDPLRISWRQNQQKRPNSEIQSIMAEVFADVLRLDEVGIEDNYFDLGGDSIKALQIISRMRERGIQLEVADIFGNPTIAGLTPKAEAVSILVSQEAVTGEVLLGPIQQWFLNTFTSDVHHFNQEVLLISEELLNADTIRQVLQALIDHHDALRTIFYKDGDVWKSEIKSTHMPVSLTVKDISNSSDPMEAIRLHAKTRHKEIELSKGPLFQATYYTYGDRCYLHLFAHHLVIDGVSWRIILEDLSLGYEQALLGNKPAFQAKTHAYKDWSKHIHEYASNVSIQKDLNYWKHIVDQAPAPLSGKTSFEASYNKGAQVINRFWKKEETSRLITKVRQAYSVGMTEILLTALSLAIRSHYDREELLVFLENHGRRGMNEGLNLDRTVGWFTASYPVILSSKGGDADEVIMKIKENLNDIPSSGVTYGMLKHLSPNEILKDTKLELEAQINFNYLGEINSQARMNRFALASESPGGGVSPDAIRFHELDFVTVVRDGRLELSLNFDPKAYEANKLNVLLDSFDTYLKILIDLSETKAMNTITPGDLTFTDLEMDELDTIAELLEGNEN